MLFTTLLSFATLAAVVSAHPGEEHRRMSAPEILARQTDAQKRHLQARNCQANMAAYVAKRRARREARKRDVISTTLSAESPHVTAIKDSTCITAPEVTEGPYYINNELVRQDLTEDQTGVQLVLDVGVVDTTTCQPLSNAFVEIWACNATGVYGGYPAQLSGPPPNTTSSSGTSTATPTGPPGGGGMGTTPLVRNETFLRGGWTTDDNGIIELTTIYPGFYTGRTAHIHTMVHTDWMMSTNGTLVSHAGSLIHIGQFFFNESWNDQVFSTSPYTDNTNNRTYNVDDSILTQESADGNNAYLELSMLGSDISDGLLGYITMGVDSSASYSITNTNYFNSTGDSDSSSATVERALDQF